MVKVKSRNVGSESIPSLADCSNEEDGKQVVRQAISKLAPSERELIILRYYNDMSHKQMSAVLGLSNAAINNRLVRVRRKISSYLKNNGLGEVET